MKGYDPTGATGHTKPLPDSVTITEPLPDKIVSEPLSEQREPVVVPPAAPVAEEYAPQEQAYQQPAETEGF
jgi:small subunit ribosomal protein S3e